MSFPAIIALVASMALLLVSITTYSLKFGFISAIKSDCGYETVLPNTLLTSAEVIYSISLALVIPT